MFSTYSKENVNIRGVTIKKSKNLRLHKSLLAPMVSDVGKKSHRLATKVCSFLEGDT